MRKSLIVLGVVAAIGVAGCSSDTATKSSAKPAKSAAAKQNAESSTSSTTQPFVSNSKNTPGTLANFVGAREDVHDTKCQSSGSGWNVEGSVTNSAATAVKYRIYVSFLNGDTTVGLTEVNVAKVGPKQTERWQQSVKVTGRDLRCILRVERADL